MSGRAGSCTSPAAARGVLSGSRSKACKRPCGARRPCSRARRPAATPPDRGRARVPRVARRRAARSLKAGSTHARATSRAPWAGVRETSQSMRARTSSCVEDALLDEQVLERTDARRGRRLAVAPDRIVRVVVFVVAHAAGSSQCSKRSAQTRSLAVGARSGQRLALRRTRRGRAAAAGARLRRTPASRGS